MAGRGGTGVDVVLDDEPAAAPGPVVAPRRRGRLLAAVLAGLVVLALVLGQAVLDHRAKARLARLAAVPGVLAPLGEELVERWRVPSTQAGVLGLPGLTPTPADDVRLLGQDESGAVVLRSWDQTTGAPRWRTALWAEPGHGQQQATCAPVPSQRLVCLLLDYAGTAADVGALLVVDLTDGTVLAEHDAPASQTLAVVDGVAAVGSTGPDGLRLTGLDVRSGATLWTTDLAADDPSSVGLSPAQESFAVQDPRTNTVTFLDTGGAVLRTWRASSSELSMSSDDETGVVVQAGDWTFVVGPYADTELPGWPVLLAVDDGSGPAQLVQAGDDLVALGDDGEVLWSFPTRASYGSSVLLDGVLYLATTRTGAPPALTTTMDADGTTYSTSPGVLLAVDARTGAVRWSRPVDEMPVQLNTDGRSLVGLTRSGLVLWSLTAGTPVRELRPPTGITALDMVGSLVVGHETGDTLVVLGSP